jgi:hypothetical protein
LPVPYPARATLWAIETDDPRGEKMKVKGILVVAALAGCALAAAPAVPAVPANDGDVRVAGSCTGPATSKLKLSAEDGRIEVELEVDQNRVGVTWTVALRRNGTRVFRGTRVTRGPSGSFELRRLVADGAGAETISARATNARGQVCTATAAWR